MIGDPPRIRRYRSKSVEDGERVVHFDIDGRVPLSTFVNEVQKAAPGIPVDDISVIASAIWIDKATPEEIAATEAHRLEDERRTHEWRTRMVREYIAEHGIPDPQPADNRSGENDG